VLRIQLALLEWDPGILPVVGVDGDYGDETATTVVKFKIDELKVHPGELVNDVGPHTLVRLDEIMHSVEAGRPVTTKYRRDV
jgi:tyrosinase